MITAAAVSSTPSKISDVPITQNSDRRLYSLTIRDWACSISA